MNLAEAPFFSLLRQRLDHLGARQRVVAENLANVTTPGFTPRDVDKKAFEAAVAAAAPQPGRLTIARTNHGHLPAARPGAAPTRIVASPDSETTLDGNRVVLEEQILKAGETRAAFETSLALYQKGLQLIRLAGRGPR